MSRNLIANLGTACALAAILCLVVSCMPEGKPTAEHEGDIQRRAVTIPATLALFGIAIVCWRRARHSPLRAMSSDADRIVGLYERHAAAWDADRGRSLFERPWLDRFLARAPADAHILDLGCGAGEPIARYVVESGRRVTGVDASPTLVALAGARFPEHEWRVDDMRRLALGRRFGAILAWDSFFHLSPDDQRRMFPIFEAHAAPGAALMFTSGPAHGVAIGSYRGEPLYHASLDPEEYRRLLDEHGFEVVSHMAEDPACGGHTVWLARRR